MKKLHFTHDALRHGVILFAASMTVNAANFAFSFLNTRALGVVDYGILWALMSALMMASVAAAITTMIVAKFSAELYASGKELAINRLARRLGQFTGLLGLTIVALTFFLKAPLAAFLNIADVLTIQVTGAILCVAIVSGGFRGLLQGTHNFAGFGVSTLIEALSRTFLGVLLVYRGLGVRGALFGYFLGMLVGMIYTVGSLFFRLRGPSQRIPIAAQRILATSTSVALSLAAITSLGFVDVLLVKHYFQPHDAGLYSAVSLCGKILLLVASFVPTLVLPKATQRAISGKSPLPVLVQAGAAVGVLSGGGLLAFFLFPDFVVRVVAGEAFAPASQYVFTYGIAMTLLAAISMVTSYKIGIHRFDFVVPLCIITAGEIVAINFVHHSIGDVVTILAVGNALGLIACLHRLNAAPEREELAGRYEMLPDLAGLQGAVEPR